MNCDGTKWGIYDDFLKQKRYINKNHTAEYAQNSIYELACNDASYQEEAKVNDVIQPILAIREEDNVCKFTAMPNDNIYVGDIIECYDEYWIVIDAYQDEYDITAGTMWLCNHLLKFQNDNLGIVNMNCVIDDGTYSKVTQKSIVTSDAQYTMYVPLTEDTNKFYIDKRFAIGIGYDKDLNKILQVMKISWIDRISQNGATGNHLLKIRLQTDVYDSTKDSIGNMICDYVDVQSEDIVVNTETSVESNLTEGIMNLEIENGTSYNIVGKDSIRVGTTRTYSIEPEASGLSEIMWTLDTNIVKIISNNNTCKISVPLDESLIGREFLLFANDNNSVCLCFKKIRVVAIG